MGSDKKYAAGPSDRTGGSAGPTLGPLLTASGRKSSGTLHVDVYDVPHGFTDKVTMTRTVTSPLSFDKVVGEMSRLGAEINGANIRYDILNANSNSAAFSLFDRLGVTVVPPVWTPGSGTRVP